MARPSHKKDFILRHRALSPTQIIALAVKRDIEMSNAYVHKVLQNNPVAEAPKPKAPRAPKASTAYAPTPTNGHSKPPLVTTATRDTQLRAEFRRMMLRVGTERAQQWLAELAIEASAEASAAAGAEADAEAN